MKLLLLFVAIFGVATAAAVPAAKVRATRSLVDDWADFYALIDTDKLIEITLQYVAEDEEVQIAITHFQGSHFHAALLRLEAVPQFTAFLDYLDAAGLEIYHWYNVLRTWIGLEGSLEPSASISTSRLASTRITGGFAGLVRDWIAALPLAELSALYDEKLETSPEFADLIKLLGSEQAIVFYKTFTSDADWIHIRGDLEDYGLDVESFFVWYRNLIGLTETV